MFLCSHDVITLHLFVIVLNVFVVTLSTVYLPLCDFVTHLTAGHGCVQLMGGAFTLRNITVTLTRESVFFILEV